jgi:CubicO group peptidase (beta-lactamase class C family)
MALVLRRWQAALSLVLAALAGTAILSSPTREPVVLGVPVSAPLAAPEPLVLTDIAQFTATLPRLNSLLVSWHGKLVFERYFQRARGDRLANVKSASKSIVSALVGIAIHRKLIAGVDAPIDAYFKDLLAKDPESRKRAITIEDLLTMRSGLETTSNRNYGAWVRSANWVRYALRQPLVSEPGTSMEYSTGSTHLLSAILTRVTKTSTLAFAREALAKPLGITLAPWPQDPQGIYFGGNEMLLTPRQMLAFGELYLNRGRANGRQIVPEAWVDASLTRRTVSRRQADRFYGYGWWSRTLAGHPVYYAWGYGGQFIFIVPSLRVTIVTTSSTAGGDERRDHRDSIYDLVEQIIIPRVEAASQSAAPPNLTS